MPRLIPLALAVVATVALLALGLSAHKTQAATAPTDIYLPNVACKGCAIRAISATATPSPTTQPGPGAFAAREIELVNEARAAVGCPAAVANDALMRGTLAWSEKMRREEFRGHTSAGYYVPFGYTDTVSGENIGSGETPEYVFVAWMASEHHRDNIEWCVAPGDPAYDPALVYDIGVGYSLGRWTLAIGSHVP